jgi:hypothetical protein
MYTLNCALLGYYAVSGGNSLLTFLENLLINYPETSVINYYYLLHNNPESAVLSYFLAEACNHTYYVYWLLLSPMLSDLGIFYSAIEMSGFSEYQLLD